MLIIQALRYDTTIEEFLLDLSDFDSVSVINCKAVLINRPYRSMKLSYPVCLIYTVSQKKVAHHTLLNIFAHG